MVTDYDEIAEEYREIKNEPWRLYCEEHMMRKLAGDVTGESVLDLACGEGHLSRRMKRWGAARVLGVDLSQGMVDLARRQEAQHPLGIDYETRDVRGLVLAETFDLVVSGWLLSYSPTKGDLLEMARAIARHLKPGGRYAAIDNHHDIEYRHFEELRRYNVGKLVPDIVVDETPVRILGYLASERSFEMEVYHYSQATYDWALQTAGLSHIVWHRPEVAQDGIDRFGSEYWDYWINHPFLMGLEATR